MAELTRLPLLVKIKCLFPPRFLEIGGRESSKLFYMALVQLPAVAPISTNFGIFSIYLFDLDGHKTRRTTSMPSYLLYFLFKSVIFAPRWDSLAGQPLHKRGRVWSTSHYEFMLQSQQWQAVRGVSSNSMLFAVSHDAVLAGLFGARHSMHVHD